jgi:hypothetical protein
MTSEEVHVKRHESGHLVKPGGKNAQHEQELPASGDYVQQRKGGISNNKEPGSKPEPDSPKKS